ncbi:MAG TPA: 30S ribosomal protein S20 [Gammaproteobacteria bacterium]|nr:30S ribosomal protein S20 [Gammaproteobacteria bacterium]
MANTIQAKKRARQAEAHREHNASLKSRFRTAVKNVVKAVQSKQKDAAVEAYKQAVPVIDAMVNKKLVHQNKAARHKSRLNAHIKALS